MEAYILGVLGSEVGFFCVARAAEDRYISEEARDVSWKIVSLR